MSSSSSSEEELTSKKKKDFFTSDGAGKSDGDSAKKPVQQLRRRGTGLPRIGVIASEHKAMKDIIRLYEMRQRRRKMARSAIIWFIFLGLFMWQVYIARNISENYHMWFGLKDILVDEEFSWEDSQIPKTFADIGSTEEWWQWAHGPLLSAITSEKDHTMYKYNSIVGAVRLRQLRIKDDSCQVSRNYRDITTHCWDDFSQGKQSKDAYGDYHQFGYTDPRAAPDESIWALATGTFTFYPAGGYIEDLPSPFPGAADGNYSSEVLAKLNYLENKNWIDRNTRAVLCDINVFNGNYNLFANCKLLCEFTAAGDILPRFIFTSFKLDLYVTSWDKFRAFLEIILLFYVIYFTIMFGVEMVRNFFPKYRLRGESVWKFYFDFWNVLDALNILVFWLMIIFTFTYMGMRRDFDWRSNDFIPLFAFGSAYQNIYNFTAFCVLISFLKSFKYLKMNPRMLLLWDTLARAAPDLVAFFIFFFIVFFGFVGMGWVCFGPQHHGFRDLIAAFTTNLQMLLGDLDYAALKEINRVLGPLYFLLFLILVFFTLSNMFLAIITEAFAQQCEQTKNTQSITAQLIKGVRRKVTRATGILRRGLTKKAPKLSNSELMRRLQYSPRAFTLGQGGAKISVKEIRSVLGEAASKEEVRRTLHVYKEWRAKYGFATENFDLVAVESASSSEDSGPDEDAPEAKQKWQRGMQKLRGIGLMDKDGKGRADVIKQNIDINSLSAAQSNLDAKLDRILNHVATMSTPTTPTAPAPSEAATPTATLPRPLGPPPGPPPAESDPDAGKVNWPSMATARLALRLKKGEEAAEKKG